jgi:beta-galactosidase
VRRLLERVYADAGVDAPRPGDGVEVVVRRGAEADYVVVVNHTDSEAGLALEGTELLSGAETGGDLRVPGGDVAVVRIPLGRGDGHPAS